MMKVSVGLSAGKSFHEIYRLKYPDLIRGLERFIRIVVYYRSLRAP